MASELDELSGRLELLEREAAGLRAALHGAQRARFILFLLVIAFIGGFGYMFYKSAKELMSEATLKTLTDMAQNRMKDNEKKLNAEVVLLMNNSRPVLEASFKERFTKDEPLFSQALQKEAEPFKASIQKKLTERLAEHYAMMIHEHKAELEKQHPELKDHPDMYVKLEHGLVEGAKRMIESMFTKQFTEKLQKLETEWAQIPAAEEPKPGEASTSNQLLGHFMEFLAVAVAKGNTLALFDDKPKAPAGSKPTAPNTSKKGK